MGGTSLNDLIQQLLDAAGYNMRRVFGEGGLYDQILRMINEGPSYNQNLIDKIIQEEAAKTAALHDLEAWLEGSPLVEVELSAG